MEFIETESREVQSPRKAGLIIPLLLLSRRDGGGVGVEVNEDEISDTSLVRRVEGARGGGGGFTRGGEDGSCFLAEDGGVAREGGGGAILLGRGLFEFEEVRVLFLKFEEAVAS